MTTAFEMKEIIEASRYNKTIGSVIGYAPADNPKFLILVKMDEPAVRIWGSDTAGPIFFNLVHDLLLYYNISP